MADLGAILNSVDDGLEASIARWCQLLEIPSISTDPAYAKDCEKAARWLERELGVLGFTAGIRPTDGLPMVVAHRKAEETAPHVLFYGHYDVQPADPLEAWTTPPFKPERKTGPGGTECIYARGAADDKGQLLTFMEACRAWINAHGALPVNVTVLLEGEEESGSPSLEPFLKANRKELSCDVALVCDTIMWNAKTPAITTRLRGMCHDEVTIVGPSVDLHSGLYGGAAVNPIRVLSTILAAMHDKRGRVAIPGFYDCVRDVPKALKAQWRALKFSERRFLGGVGLKQPAGETNRSLLEQLWSRPTAEINGIFGGYTGHGTKTVIPSKASAKLSFRLVPGQDPAKVLKNFRAFVKARLPKDCTAAFDSPGEGSAAIEIPEDNAYLRLAAAALKDEFRKEPVLMGCGASIPIVRSFKDILRMESLLIGFGLEDDAIHSPNEKYNISSFQHGIRSWARVLGKLART